MSSPHGCVNIFLTNELFLNIILLTPTKSNIDIMAVTPNKCKWRTWWEISVVPFLGLLPGNVIEDRTFTFTMYHLQEIRFYHLQSVSHMMFAQHSGFKTRFKYFVRLSYLCVALVFCWFQFLTVSRAYSIEDVLIPLLQIFSLGKNILMAVHLWWPR